MSSKVRVRFAPSPTGPLHIGGVRTALFNYLFAKKNGGDFLLRIEDTDQNRYVEGAEQYIIDSLNWCGIYFDEGPASTSLASTSLSDHNDTSKLEKYGPYRQSERKGLYKEYADELVSNGHAYYAFDTQEELDVHRKDHETKGKTFIYNWHNRLKLQNSLSLSDKETQEKLISGQEYVIRFKSPKDEKLVLTDIIRGTIEIDTNVLDDKVLFKSDGMPTYHLANIVDDHLMEISHVIRGEEWLPSLALHYQLYNAFGWKTPEFAHLPLIMKPVGKGKLSKRDGEKMGFPVLPLSWGKSVGYREEGYFPEAVVNFLALLGWNPGTEQELFTLEELVETFTLERVHKSGARFDPEKTKWYNHQYMQSKGNRELALMFAGILNSKLKDLLKEDVDDMSDFIIHAGEQPDVAFIEKVISLIKERATFVSDFWELSDYFFVAPSRYAENAVKKHWKEETPAILTELITTIENVGEYTSTILENSVKTWIAESELSFGKVMPPLRLAIVGDMKGPHLFDIMELIGKEESIERIRKAVSVL